MSTGTVGILNVGAGDIRLEFNSADPAERIRAGRVVRDMLRRGFALLIEVERDGKKAFERALDFDEAKACYIIADFDSAKAEEADAWGQVNHEANQAEIARKTHGESSTPEAASVEESAGAAPRRGSRRTAGR